ncbi:IclR family transcriptional regulator [Leucobacter sp. M11]|uniref:IclR family transcriptional regulator n=1 Tax=Leucobacter sp. M11 TaxID=2993565 RepID=UPI002D7E7E66|nr:IclR family transcriptional regulator [Leucobacter sp. M11]MEB4615213.1 IclR family transcriptional regulator [Leucobacter sp. M11]
MRDPGNEGKTTSTMRSLERAFDVIAAIEGAGVSLRLTDIAHATHLHASTVTRILSVLMRRGFVEQDRAGRYRLGPLFLSGSHAFLSTDTRSRLVQPILQELAEVTGHTASFYVQHDDSRVLVARVDGSQPLRYQIPIGRRLPLHLGGGKVLAAGFTSEERARFLSAQPSLDHVSGQNVTRAAFEAELLEIRKQGFHYARGERELGMQSLAVPVRGTNEYERPAMVIIATRADDSAPAELLQWVSELKTAARAIEQLSS